jgi:hypothetical protein
MQRKGFLSLWLLAGFLLPPIIWLGMGLYIELWSWEEMLRFLIDPPFLMWIYMWVFLSESHSWLFQMRKSKIPQAIKESPAPLEQGPE